MKFKVLQMQLTDSDVAVINSEGWSAAETNPRVKAYLDKMHGKVGNGEFHTHVANIEAIGLEDVFRIGNVGPEENIERLTQMHSVSVGDIIEDDEGTRFVVANVGFELLEA